MIILIAGIASTSPTSIVKRQDHVEDEAAEVINQLREGLIDWPVTNDSITSIEPHAVHEDLRGSDYEYLGQLKDGVYTIWVIAIGSDEIPLTGDDNTASETYKQRKKND